jgi:hypothetical protein
MDKKPQNKDQKTILPQVQLRALLLALGSTTVRLEDNLGSLLLALVDSLLLNATT